MRILGTVLFLLGLVVTAVGSFMGFGSLFSWNGRHAIAVHPLTVDSPLHSTLEAKAGRRYTFAIQVVVDRQGLVEKDGALVVEARMPIVATLKDSAGTSVSSVVGWMDPNEPPTVLYGQGHDASRRPPGAPAPELVFERLLGPWPVAITQPLSVDVTLGTDRGQEIKIASSRLVVYDDALPPSITLPLGVAGTGAVILLAGMAILGLRGLRRLLARRGGIRRRQSV